MAIVFFRTVILFSALLLFMRLLGKRQLGELELSELLVSVMMADIASIPLQDIGIPLINGLLAVLILFSLEILVSGLTLRFLRLRTLFFGRPSFLMEKGVINQTEMRRNRFSLDELMEALRSQGITDFTEVDYAVLETDGTLNVIQKAGYRAVTASQMGIMLPEEGYPTILINNGRILSRNVVRCGKDEPWLLRTCRENGVHDTKDVYLLSYTPGGKTVVIRKDGKK